MKIRLRVMVTAACVASMTWATPALAKSQVKAGADTPAEETQGPAPEDAVRALYSPYLPGGDESKSAFDNESERAKRFSASLVKELKAYFQRQEKAGEPGGLDFDPIVNGQDYKIGQLEVRADKTVPGKSAVVIAEFKNFDESVNVKFKMTFESGAWKVDDISSLRDPVWDLRDLLKAD